MLRTARPFQGCQGFTDMVSLKQYCKTQVAFINTNTIHAHRVRLGRNDALGPGGVSGHMRALSQSHSTKTSIHKPPVSTESKKQVHPYTRTNAHVATASMSTKWHMIVQCMCDQPGRPPE